MTESLKLIASINEAAMSDAQIGDVLIAGMVKICLSQPDPMVAVNQMHQSLKSKVIEGMKVRVEQG